jgi:cytochrome c oxidase subunit III
VAAEHGHHGAAGAAPVAHHFDNLRQQQSAVRFGMWLFLVTEVLFFGGIMVAYTAYRIWFPREFEAGSAALNVGIASVNTFLLLASSLTITLAIRACYVGNRSGLQMWLGLTIILGAAFLALKAREYSLDYQEGLIPGGNPTSLAEGDVGSGIHQVPERSKVGPPESEAAHDFGSSFRHVIERERKHHGLDLEKEGISTHRVQLFFLFYYCMTGLHVLHMIVGLGLLGWQFVLAKTGFFDHPERYVYVEVMSLYWHFVDMVWIFLLPLLYLAGPHTGAQAVEQFQHAIGLGH